MKGGYRVIFTLLFLVISTATGQQPGPHEASRPLAFYKVRVIDSNHRPIRGLESSDFEVGADEQTQQIAYFREVQGVAIKLAMLLDVGPAMSDEEVLKGKRLFFDLIHRLGTEDRIQIATFDRDVCFLSPLTSDRLELLDALNDISPGMSCGEPESRWVVEGGEAKLPHGGDEVPKGREQTGPPNTTEAGQLAAQVSFRASQSLAGNAITQALIRLRKITENEPAILAVSAGLPNVGEATLRDLRTEGANLFAVSMDVPAEDLLSLGINQSARRRLVNGSGGFLLSEDSILERVTGLADILNHYYLIGLPRDPEQPPPSEAPQFSIKGDVDYRITAALADPVPDQ